MAGPRLLDKKVVNTQVAQERKQLIETGLALAKKVDSLREEKGKEEQELDAFRRESIARIQAEIDAKIGEKEYLLKEINRLKEERLETQAPLDLQEEWSRVKEERSELSSWKEHLTSDSISLLAKEEDNRCFSEKLESREQEIRVKELSATQNLTEAEQKYTKADEALVRAERQAQDLLKDAQQRDNHLKIREEEATTREVWLSKREEEVNVHEVDLAAREKKLKSRQETFAKAQKYIKSKK